MTFSSFMGGVLCVVVCWMALAGCRSSLEPEDFAGTYTLRRVGGDALPAVLFEGDASRIVVVADTLILRSDRTASLVSFRATESLAGEGLSVAHRVQTEYRFVIADRTVELAIVCPPNADCAPPPHVIANRLGGVLLVRYVPENAVAPLSYERVDDSQ